MKKSCKVRTLPRVETGLWTFVAGLAHAKKGVVIWPSLAHVSAYSAPLRSAPLNGLNGARLAKLLSPFLAGLGQAKKILAAPWPIGLAAPGGAYKDLIT